MRGSNPIKLARLESAPPKADANVYDLGLRQDENVRLCRIRELEFENALLMRIVSETHIEIARLREQLASY